MAGSMRLKSIAFLVGLLTLLLFGVLWTIEVLVNYDPTGWLSLAFKCSTQVTQACQQLGNNADYSSLFWTLMISLILGIILTLLAKRRLDRLGVQPLSSLKASVESQNR